MCVGVVFHTSAKPKWLLWFSKCSIYFVAVVVVVVDVILGKYSIFLCIRLFFMSLCELFRNTRLCFVWYVDSLRFFFLFLSCLSFSILSSLRAINALHCITVLWLWDVQHHRIHTHFKLNGTKCTRQHAIKQDRSIDFGAFSNVCVYIACTGDLNKTIRNEARSETGARKSRHNSQAICVSAQYVLYTNRLPRNQTQFTNTLRFRMCVCLENCVVRTLSFYFRPMFLYSVTLCVQ